MGKVRILKGADSLITHLYANVQYNNYILTNNNNILIFHTRIYKGILEVFLKVSILTAIILSKIQYNILNNIFFIRIRLFI